MIIIKSFAHRQQPRPRHKIYAVQRSLLQGSQVAVAVIGKSGPILAHVTST
jgi:hypothetical protein